MTVFVSISSPCSAQWSLSIPWKQPDGCQMLSTTTLTQHTPSSRLLHPPGPSLPHLEDVRQATDLSTLVIRDLHILITALPGLKVLLDGLHFPLPGVELPQPSAREDHQEVSPGEDISHQEEDVHHDPCLVLAGQAPTRAPPSSHQPQFKSRQRRLIPILTPS